MQYQTGTVTVTNGSAAVVGSGTNWASDSDPVMAGDSFTVIGDNATYQVASVQDDTHLSLTTNYTSRATASGLLYYITRDFTTLGIPVLKRGDVDVPNVIGRMATVVDTLIQAKSTVTRGTWNPQLAFGGNYVGMTHGATPPVGNWTQVGNLVFFNCIITLSAKGSSTGAATILNLPSPSGPLGGLAWIGWWSNMATSPNYACFVGANSNVIVLGKQGTGFWVTLYDADFNNNSNLEVFGFYFTL
jgi:hypothetical protein